MENSLSSLKSIDAAMSTTGVEKCELKGGFILLTLLFLLSELIENTSAHIDNSPNLLPLEIDLSHMQQVHC